MIYWILSGFLLVGSGLLHADEPYKNILIYNQGDIQLTASIDRYEQLAPGTPIKGTVMITRGGDDKVDPKSFSMGGHPLKAEFVETQPFSSYDGSLVIDIYRFEADSKEIGSQTLPSIKVKINGREYAAPPLSIQVDPS